MVHHTMPSSSTKAPKASNNNSPMVINLRKLAVIGIVGILAACTSVPEQSPPSPQAAKPVPPPIDVTWPEDNAALPGAITQPKSRWTPVRWRELPGLAQDTFSEAWSAWLHSCERPAAVIGNLCPEVRRLSLAGPQEQLGWMMRRLQPYRVEPLDGSTDSLLTSYYEPVFNASRTPRPGFTVPLYKAPATLNSRKPWYSRQEMDTVPEARAALKGREIAYLADPIDALILQVQGSGRMRMLEPDGSQRLLRLAFAGSNEQPYKSVGRWLIDQGALKDASWASIKAWAAQNPQRLNDMLYSNPRVIFFREEPVDGDIGPKGAQGVPLTAGRSIAVDRASIPYGAPVWLASSGLGAQLQRLVLAQDTGSAITGAVRADYYAGSGDAAGEFANRIKQPLQMWVLWPK
jgi:membrane-bound lytic murein transglycosylase A